MVYLVEDDENIRELVTYTLNSQGIETESFERPSKFWKAMQQEIPSLFLLDIMGQEWKFHGPTLRARRTMHQYRN